MEKRSRKVHCYVCVYIKLFLVANMLKKAKEIGLGS